jgi:putative endonuclease
MRGYVYILRCNDGSYYVGSTTNLEERVRQHNDDVLGAAYTRRRRPVRLIWHAEFSSIAEAYAVEKQVQGWSRRKREAFMRGEFELLPGLSKRKQRRAPR